MTKNERNFWLDWIMFCAFSITIVSGFLLWLIIPHDATSVFAGIDRAAWLAFHIVSGILGLTGVIIHIIWHRDWLKALRGRSPGTLKGPVRANRLTNRLTWFSYIFSNVSGMLLWLLSTGVPSGAIKILCQIHTATSMAWLVFLTIHLVFHQKWIVSAIKRYVIFSLPIHVKANSESRA